MYLSAHACKDGAIAFEKEATHTCFISLLASRTTGTRPVGVMAYIVDRGSRQELFRKISHSGLKVEAVSPGKSVDGRLIFDLIVGAQRDFYDVCILASGDRDYVPVVRTFAKPAKLRRSFP